MKRKVLVKMGGSTLDTDNVLAEFAEAVARVPYDSDVVVVHGGGKDIARQLKHLGRDFEFLEGLRVTDDEIIDVVEMTLSGTVNKWITRALESHGVRAAGISGTDLGLFHAQKLVVKSGDLGFVGSIETVNTELVEMLLQKQVTPVVSPISIGPGHRAYNVNADHAACKLAEAWAADDLIYITDVPGISIAGEKRDRIAIDEIEGLIDSEEITGGMIPKVMNSASAVINGVGRVHIIGWKGPDSIVDSLNPETHWGTVVEK